MTQPHAGAASTAAVSSRSGRPPPWASPPGAASPSPPTRTDPFGGFLLGAQSYTFRHFDLEQTLKHLKDLGLHYVEFYQKHVPLDSTPDQLAAVLKLCKEYEVTPLAWGVQNSARTRTRTASTSSWARRSA